jgi:multidrug efflux pump subunit AcrA (membrane-fusion protein)
MKPIWIALLAISILLAACASPVTPAPVPTVAPTAAPSGVIASALVVPAQSAEIAFVIPGPVKEILIKEGEQVTEGQPLVMVDSPALLGALNAAEAALRAAEFDYAYWIPPRLKRPPERKQLALDTLTQAQKAFAVAENEFAQTTLTAPFDATVAEVRVSAGEYVQPGQTLLVLANLNQFIIETTDLSERDATRVKVGQSATVYIEAINAELPATVIAISPLAKMVGGDVVYKVTLTFDKQPDGLLWGMTAEVRIVTE